MKCGGREVWSCWHCVCTPHLLTADLMQMKWLKLAEDIGDIEDRYGWGLWC